MASLHSAIAGERVQQVRVLLGLGVDTTWVDKYGRTAIMKVALMESTAKSKIIASLLLPNEIDFTAFDCYGRSALAYAAMSGREFLVKECIGDANFDLRRKDIYGHTCLMYAAMSGNPNCVRYLVELYRLFGLSLDDRNPSGFTAYLLSVMYKNDECSDILKNEGEASKQVCDDQRFWDDKAWAEIASLALQSVDITLLQELGGNPKLNNKGAGARRPHTAPGMLPNLEDSQFRFMRAQKFVRITTMNFNKASCENSIERWNENNLGMSYKRRLVSSLSDYLPRKRPATSSRSHEITKPVSSNVYPLSDTDMNVLSRAWADNHPRFISHNYDRITAHFQEIGYMTFPKEASTSTSTHLHARPRTRKTSPNSIPFSGPSFYDDELQQKEIRISSPVKTRGKQAQPTRQSLTSRNQKGELCTLFEQYSAVQLPVRKGFKQPDPPRILLTPTPTGSLSRRNSRLMSISSIRKQRISRRDSISITSRMSSL